ncbi:hypothetical protein [Mucilaginibacter psychrotolerans]|uniref:Uncharacterized protein n=1 Tax=Mucilaginibacter psychrotolerans TaxID=1524096 RepID=A0A4Y8SL75_9SPHI|nr:hypothetical protein [Mucilaginibacter psychrotolerans]TFF39799.1 hypothetical protein E2R66_05395 [Mucilaginibacter psychrotolerans]
MKKLLPLMLLIVSVSIYSCQKEHSVKPASMGSISAKLKKDTTPPSFKVSRDTTPPSKSTAARDTTPPTK